MIFTKTLIPEVYSESYDMSIFTGILDLIYNAADLNILALKALHAPSYCFRHNLQHLASSFNLQSNSRDVLLKYRHLIKIKGTTQAIEAAILLAGATSLTKATVLTPSSIEPTLVTYYAKYERLDDELLRALLERVAPVDISVRVLPEELAPKAVKK